MSRNFFYISENKAGFSYRAFVICYIENNISRISHRRIIKSCIPAHNYNPNHLALSVAKCNPGSRKTVEHPLESCTSSFICFISMYVLKARILDLILKPAPPHPFVYHFWQRRYTFCIPSIEKWCTLHIPNWCKCTVYLNKPQKPDGGFSTFSQP